MYRVVDSLFLFSVNAVCCFDCAGWSAYLIVICRTKLLSRNKTSSLTARSISLARRPTSVGMLILVWASRLPLLLLTADTSIRSARSPLMWPFVELFWRDWSFPPRWSVRSLCAVTTCVMWRSTDGRRFEVVMNCSYEKRHRNIPAHCSPCFDVKEGDIVTIGQCRFVLLVVLMSRPLSKTVRFNVIGHESQKSKGLSNIRKQFRMF